MKFTKRQKILGAVLAIGAVVVTADRLFFLENPEVSASGKHAPAMAAAQKLRSTPGSDKQSGRDAFASGSALKQAPADTPKTDPSDEQFQQTHRLTGVLTAGGQSHAMIDGKIISIGQMLDGYRLASIERRSATFEKGQNRAVLMMAERTTPVAGAGQ